MSEKLKSIYDVQQELKQTKNQEYVAKLKELIDSKRITPEQYFNEIHGNIQCIYYNTIEEAQYMLDIGLEPGKHEFTVNNAGFLIELRNNNPDKNIMSEIIRASRAHLQYYNNDDCSDWHKKNINKQEILWNKESLSIWDLQEIAKKREDLHEEIFLILIGQKNSDYFLTAADIIDNLNLPESLKDKIANVENEEFKKILLISRVLKDLSLLNESEYANVFKEYADCFNHLFFDIQLDVDLLYENFMSGAKHLNSSVIKKVREFSQEQPAKKIFAKYDIQTAISISKEFGCELVINFKQYYAAKSKFDFTGTKVSPQFSTENDFITAKENENLFFEPEMKKWLFSEIGIKTIVEIGSKKAIEYINLHFPKPEKRKHGLKL